MKLYILLLLLFLCGCLGLSAQTFRGGFLAGGNLCAIDGAGLNGNNNTFNKIGFTAGGFVNARVGRKTLLQMEMAYSQKGSTLQPSTDNDNNYYLLRLNYIDIALAVRYRLHFLTNKQPTTKFDIIAGAALGKLIFSSYTVKSIVTPVDLNNTDISLFVGLVCNFSQNVCLDFRYYNSLMPSVKRDAYNSQYLYYGSWNRGDNLVFQLTLKFTFGKPGTPSLPPPASAS